MKKLFLLSLMCFVELVMNAQSFVDLGLPSGTKWKTQNQSGLYTYDDAKTMFGNRIPTKEQWEELQIECSWEWTGSGYKVVGINGNSIVLPAEGYHECGESIEGVGYYGSYWSSSPYESQKNWSFGFMSDRMRMYYEKTCSEQSIRLVQN